MWQYPVLAWIFLIVLSLAVAFGALISFSILIKKRIWLEVSPLWAGLILYMAVSLEQF
jgi:hypothetical protein